MKLFLLFAVALMIALSGCTIIPPTTEFRQPAAVSNATNQPVVATDCTYPNFVINAVTGYGLGVYFDNSDFGNGWIAQNGYKESKSNMGCRFGSRIGENVNYLYCDSPFYLHRQNISPNGTIGAPETKQVGMTIQLLSRATKPHSDESIGLQNIFTDYKVIAADCVLPIKAPLVIQDVNIPITIVSSSMVGDENLICYSNGVCTDILMPPRDRHCVMENGVIKSCKD